MWRRRRKPALAPIELDPALVARAAGRRAAERAERLARAYHLLESGRALHELPFDDTPALLADIHRRLIRVEDELMGLRRGPKEDIA